MRDAALPAGEAAHLAPGITDEAALAGRVFAMGRGSFLYDVDGNAYLDFASGILTQNVGHAHPSVIAAVSAQLAALTNVHDSSTPARDALCTRLAQVFPPHLSRFAFFSSGTEAIEAAIRAIQGHAGPDRPVIAALRGGFHGKTQGARALVGWNIGHVDTSPNARQFNSAHCFKCPLGLHFPICDIACAQDIAGQIDAADDLAAIVFEPIQTAAGVVVPPRDYWRIIADACQRNDVLMVADEIVSAGGRTGAFLACEHYGIEPDLVTAAKGLSSGIPFSLLAGREAIMTSGSFGAAGASSSTFGGNPLSCAAVSATLDVLRDEDLIATMPARSRLLAAGLDALRTSFPDAIADIRGIGLLFAIEFGPIDSPSSERKHRADEFYRACLDRGVRIGVGGNTVRIAPPLNVSLDHIAQATAIFADALRQPVHA